MLEISWPVRVYYEDTDSGGVVYYANYLRFMERARTELLRRVGFEQDALIRDEGILFAVRSVAVDYLQPARFNDLLTVTARVTQARKASLVFDQKITRDRSGDVVELCTGVVKIACLDAKSMRPTAIPEKILREVNGES
jgi:acyl-CoA thioester hydrolase